MQNAKIKSQNEKAKIKKNYLNILHFNLSFLFLRFNF